MRYLLLFLFSILLTSNAYAGENFDGKAVIKQVRGLCKEFKIMAGYLKGALAKGRGEK